MTAIRLERWGAATGLAAFVTGAIGGALERGWPSASDPAAVAVFIAEHRTAILAQSMAFLLSTAFYLWFFGSLRTFLLRGGPDAGSLPSVAQGAGTVWASLQMTAQALQVGAALAPAERYEPTYLWSMAALFSISNLPFAVMLLATAVITFRTRVFPVWLGWLSLVAAGAETLLWVGTVVRSGPLGTSGWITYLLYPMIAIWLLPTAIVMMKKESD